MKPKSDKSKIHKIKKGAVREDAKEQGFYDGRFRSRVVPDKKKKQSKESARKFKKKSKIQEEEQEE